MVIFHHDVGNTMNINSMFTNPPFYHGKDISGSIAVDVTSDDHEEKLTNVLAVLSDAGWISKGEDSIIKIEEAAKFIPPANKPTIVLCRTKKQSNRLDAIEPESLAILEALGGLQLEHALVESLNSFHKADKVIIGFNWTFIRSGDLCGIARSPARGTEGARTIRPKEGFQGMNLQRLASLILSLDPLERSVGLAAINCFWNRINPPKEVKEFIQPGGGLAGINPPGEGTVIIGGFRAAQKRLPKASIVEREPKTGDIHSDSASSIIHNAKTLAITAQTLMNGSLGPILLTSQMVPQRMLVGPSAPASPILLEFGLDETFGTVIIDPEAAEDFIIETGTMIMLDHIASTRSIRSPKYNGI